MQIDSFFKPRILAICGVAIALIFIFKWLHGGSRESVATSPIDEKISDIPPLSAPRDQAHRPKSGPHEHVAHMGAIPSHDPDTSQEELLLEAKKQQENLDRYEVHNIQDLDQGVPHVIVGDQGQDLPEVTLSAAMESRRALK